MKEIYHNLYIGSQEDYENTIKGQKGWYVIHACKEPYHRQVLGYKGRAAPKNHPEYFFAHRENRLILNLIDADTPDYIPKLIIDEVINEIDKQIKDFKVLVHCNQGFSRSATIGLLYLHHIHVISDNFSEAEKEYLKLYPGYCPKNGIRMFAFNNWNNY